MRRRRWTRVAFGAAALALCAALSVRVGAAGVRNPNPYWFQDSYRGTQYVDLGASTAIVDTAGTGTVYLPPLSADAIAYAPAFVGADIFEVATAGGVRGWGFNGAGMVREPFLDVPVSQPAGVAFLAQSPRGRPSLGVRLAVGSASGVGIYAWNGQVWAESLTISAPGVIGVAAGADGGVLAASAGGFTLYAPGGQEVAAVSGLADLRGIASAAGGSLVSVWTAAGASFYAWNGAAYAPLLSWQEPAPSGGTLVGVAFFRGGGGFWLVTATQAAAYGWNGAALVPLSGWSSTDTPSSLVAAATGWAGMPGGLALLSPTGVRYMDAPVGALAADPTRSLTGQAWPVFASSAALQSVVLAVGHDVSEVKMVDTMAALPAAASFTYEVSTDGGSTWTTTPPMTPTDVPAGASLVYRALLGTSTQAATPILDTTNLYEIATQTTSATRAVSWLLP